MKLIRDCLTGLDGVTWDSFRILIAGGGGVFLGGGISEIVTTGRLTYQDFGLGFGALLAAGGGGILMKRHTEPAITTATATDATGDVSTVSVETGAP